MSVQYNIKDMESALQELRDTRLEYDGALSNSFISIIDAVLYEWEEGIGRDIKEGHLVPKK